LFLSFKHMNVNISSSARQTGFAALAVDPRFRDEDELAIRSHQNSRGQSLKPFSRSPRHAL
jgi:hypothetical protein